MDGIRFDGWAKSVASGRTSRQGLLRLAAAAGLATVAGGAAPVAAARCRRNNKPCVVGVTDDCCSGRCAPVRGTGGNVGRCRGSRAARGCTIQDNSCAPRNQDDPISCPQRSSGTCFILRNGQPFCATDGGCFNCSDNDDCNRRFDRQGGRCINCANCPRHNRRLCIFA